MFNEDTRAASSSLIALLVGGLVFMASIGTLLVTSDGAADEAANAGTGQAFGRAQAGELGQLLFGSPGVTTTGLDWVPVEGEPGTAELPEQLGRLGLMDATTGLLSYDKFENLRLAGAAANASDNKVNYPEARLSLGLDTAGLDFHIRAFPSLREVQEILETGKKDPKLRAAYIGHQIGGNGNGNGGGGGSPIDIPVANLSCSQGSSSDILEMSVDVTNNGLGATLFEVALDLQFTSSSVRVQDITTLLAASATQTVRMDVPAIAGRDCANLTTVDIEIYDADGLLDDKSNVPFALGTNPTTATQEFHLLVPGKAMTTDQSITLDFDYAPKNDWVRVIIREGDDPAGVIAHQPPDIKAKQSNSQQKYVVPAGTLGVGHYTAYVSHLASGETLTGTLYVVAPGNLPPLYANPNGGGGGGGGGSYEWDVSAGVEADMLSSLVQQFCPYNHDSDFYAPGSPASWADRCTGFQAAGTGDVFPDATTPLQNSLVPLIESGGLATLDNINILVIGSNVQHNPMVHIKSEVEAWVDAGGTLIVFGSESSNTQWMNSIFHIGIASSSTGLTTNDADHPVLHVADDLAYTDYDNRGQSWKFTGDAADKFTNVLGLGDDSAMAVTDPGAFSKGNVIATTFFPYDIFNNGGQDGGEGLRLMNNVLMLGYRTLYLDYGPELPEGKEILPSVQRASILHPDLGIVALDMIVFVWDS